MNTRVELLKISSPLWVGISVTNKCNLKCVHCIYSAGVQDENEFSTDEIIDLLEQSKNMGVYTVEFLGGEPFCRDDIDQLIIEARKRGLGVVINTNATMINRGWVQKFKDDVMLFKIGFDGSSDDEHDDFRKGEGAYKRTLNAISYIQEAGIDTCLITTLHKNNFKRIGEIVLKASQIIKKGVFTITLLTPRGRGENIRDLMLEPEEVKFALSEIKKMKARLSNSNPRFLIKEELPESLLLDSCEKNDSITGLRLCTAAVTQMGISADGWAYPCTTMMGYRSDDHNVRTNKLYDIWNNSQLFRNIRNRNLIEGKCKKCKYLHLCGGGCRYAAWAITNDIFAPDPFCWYEPEDNS